ncbi:MAG: hypothetical protein GY951_14395, partial [Psychromonas sp.]|nr:hypothetical protein [Psychromonas sp.]
KVNSLPWNGYTEKAVLCTSINADEQGDTYKVKFTFAVEDATWQFVGAVKHNDLKMPVSHHPTNPDYNFDIYQAAKRFDVYEFVDFTPLGFDLNVVFANLSGTAMDFPTLSETEIKAGGDTIIITLYNDTWVAAGATFDAVRQDILDGLVSNKSEANGWNAELAIPRTLSVSSVVRTSSTVVTITTTANALYEITESEIISCTIPASALVTTSSDMIPANKAFTIGGG